LFELSAIDSNAIKKYGQPRFALGCAFFLAGNGEKL
jgi:hypothetical protein